MLAVRGNTAQTDQCAISPTRAEMYASTHSNKEVFGWVTEYYLMYLLFYIWALNLYRLLNPMSQQLLTVCGHTYCQMASQKHACG